MFIKVLAERWQLVASQKVLYKRMSEDNPVYTFPGFHCNGYVRNLKLEIFKTVKLTDAFSHVTIEFRR